MRASTGIGIIALISLIACSAADAGQEPTLSKGPSGTSSPSGASDAPGGGGTNTPAEKPSTVIVSNLAVSDVTVLQGVNVPVVTARALVAPAQRNAPVVMNRQGLLRVYVKPASGWVARQVTAEVQLVAPGKAFPILRDTKTISGTSTDEDLESTFNVDVPAADLVTGVTFQVSLTSANGIETPAGKASDGRFPADGSLADLGAQPSTTLKLVIVPMAYGADGSGRLPDVSATQLAIYKQMMMKRYPIADVQISAHKPFPWDSGISDDGTGFDEALDAIHELRQQDGVADDVYYYGAFAPAESFDSFCPRGCTAGLSTVADIDTPELRASVGLGFSGEETANTMSHEVGHAHGRNHAPCGGAQGVDENYPYPDAQLGSWGYDIFDKTLIAPSDGRDMMGYCPHEWVSDYTFRALYDRSAALAGNGGTGGAEKPGSFGPQAQVMTARYHVASVSANGALRWVGKTGLTVDAAKYAKRGTGVSARYLAENGAEIATRSARFFPFDHLRGGFLFVPEESGIAWKSVRVDGYRQPLARR